MAEININFYSNQLKRKVTFTGIIPSDRPDLPGWPSCEEGPYKALYLLHGYSGNQYDWISGSIISELAMKYNIAVFMPSGENNFYIDDESLGAYYTKFVGEELVEVTRKLFPISKDKKDTFIGGFSMGGYGALRTGILYPQTFGKIMAISSALIVKDIQGMAPDFRDAFADYNYYSRVFGDLDNILESDKNLEYIINQSLMDKVNLPQILMACGTEDFLRDNNKDFSEFLESKNIKHELYLSEGIHNWTFINKNLENWINTLLDKDMTSC